MKNQDIIRTARSNLNESEPGDPYLSGSVSSDTECTGLMPTPPASDAELEAYEELYPFRPAQTAPRE
ncbi:MAG: hypothetical protein LUG56_01345 [Lachnospiraceae bacterium]|nr:hypothetical protein [Lachnospiraceae bacterium]MCD7841095.1 hypothetical protein [Lachnospiraceae bacterium]